MFYYRKRKKDHKIDEGTIELRKKRNNLSTFEVFDICLKKNLITSEQHLYGMFLRKLHYIKYSSATVKAYNYANLGGKSTKVEYIEWQAQKEKELSIVLNKLEQINAINTVVNICIFHHIPNFLYKSPKYRTCIDEYYKFLHGLDILKDHFREYPL